VRRTNLVCSLGGDCYRKSFAEQHPVLLGVGIVLGACTVAALWPLFLALTVIGGIGWLAYWLLMRSDTETQRHRAHQAERQARAAYEHHLWLHGDPRGFYGRYPPAVRPSNVGPVIISLAWGGSTRLLNSSSGRLQRAQHALHGVDLLLLADHDVFGQRNGRWVLTGLDFVLRHRDCPLVMLDHLGQK
jgi:hypothetical protein